MQLKWLQTTKHCINMTWAVATCSAVNMQFMPTTSVMHRREHEHASNAGCRTPCHSRCQQARDMAHLTNWGL